MLYSLTHATGGRWSWEEVAARNIRIFAEQGIRLYQVDLYFEDLWFEGSDELDLTLAARQVQGVVDQVPQASVFVRVHINAPFWWNRAHPEERVEYAEGPIDDSIVSGLPMNNETGDPQRARRTSLASKQWREVTTAKLIEFCERFSQLPESNAVVGIHVCCGVYGEWHYWGFQHDPDAGPAMTGYFRDWLRDKYEDDAELQSEWRSAEVTLETAEVPGLAPRRSPTELGFRDPERERPLLDYLQCQHELVAESITHFAAKVRSHWPRKTVIGVFCGYFFNLFGRHDTGAHLEVDRVLRCPDVDYFSSPQCQWRETQLFGGSGFSRGLVDSARLHGKLWLDEIDNGCRQENYVVEAVGVVLKPNARDLALARRSSIHPILRGQGAWYYDFGITKSRGWWDHPKYLTRIGHEMEVFQRLAEREFDSMADVLFVHSMRSFYYLYERNGHLMRAFVDRSVERFYRCGGIADHVYDTDLEKCDLSRYRVVIFNNTVVFSDSERRWIRENVCRDGRVVLWTGLPGYTDGDCVRLDAVSELTGFEVGKSMDFIVPAYIHPELAQLPVTFGESAEEHPILVWKGSDGEVLARCSRSGACIAARRQFDDHTAVVVSLPIAEPAFYRWVLRSGNAHVWETSGDPLFGGYGAVALHTRPGGERRLRLKDGCEILHQLPAESTSLFDATTGEVLLANRER